MPLRRRRTLSAGASVEKLLEDMHVVVRDAEGLLKATAAQTGEKVQEARARAEESLRHARAYLGNVDEAVKHARALAGDAERHLRDNPWQAVGIAAAIGLVLALLVSRR